MSNLERRMQELTAGNTVSISSLVGAGGGSRAAGSPSSTAGLHDPAQGPALSVRPSLG